MEDRGCDKIDFQVQFSIGLFCSDFQKMISNWEKKILLTFLGNTQGSNVSTTPITEMGCRQCLPLGVVQLKGKHCQKPHCRNGVVDTFEQRVPLKSV